MKKILLTEVTIPKIQIISENSKTGTFKIRCPFQRADEDNNNGRYYTKSLLSREVTRMNESIDARQKLGELDHPSHSEVKLSQASHLITKLEWNGNELIGEAEILPTDAGNTARKLIEAGVAVGVSSRGVGTVSESGGRKRVNEDFQLITFDLVADPSTRGAYASVCEGTEITDELMSALQESTGYTVFMNMLKKRVTPSKKFHVPSVNSWMNEAKKPKKEKKDNPWKEEEVGVIEGEPEDDKKTSFKSKEDKDKKSSFTSQNDNTNWQVMEAVIGNKRGNTDRDEEKLRSFHGDPHGGVGRSPRDLRRNAQSARKRTRIASKAGQGETGQAPGEPNSKAGPGAVKIAQRFGKTSKLDKAGKGKLLKRTRQKGYDDETKRQGRR